MVEGCTGRKKLSQRAFVITRRVPALLQVIAKINAAQAAGVGAANPAAPKTLTKGFMDPESHGIVGLNPMTQLSAMQPPQPKLLPNGMPAPRKPKRPVRLSS